MLKFCGEPPQEIITIYDSCSRIIVSLPACRWTHQGEILIALNDNLQFYNLLANCLHGGWLGSFSGPSVQTIVISDKPFLRKAVIIDSADNNMIQ